ncbi:MAG TPA: hypothetical protein VFS21_35985 [Roseiflexaceae bacterium]|nr:hypothetical protein [Roseiflexaceae bacterium]
MTNNCLQELTEGQNRLYRLLDTALNGTQYAELPDGEISPAIPAVPPAGTTEANALRAQAARLWQLAENAATAAEFTTSAIDGGPALDETTSWAARLLAVQGTSPGGWFGVGAKPVQLLDLLKAGRVNDADDKSKIGQAIDQVDSALDVGTDLGTFIKGFLDSAAELGTDGGLIAVQLALGAANARLMQRIYTALDGGGLFVPSDEENNLLTYARKAAMDDAGAANAGQRLTDIYERLGELQQVIRGSGETGTVTARLDYLSTQLRALADLDAEGNPVAGNVLAAFDQLLQCICEGVNGTPSTPTWPPPPEAPCGSSFPTPALRATVSSFAFEDGIWQGDITAWEVVEPVAGVTWVSTPAGPLVSVAGSTTRQLCISYQWPEGVTDYPAGTLGFNFEPWLVDGSRPASRPTISYEGSEGETEVFYEREAETDEVMGYIAGPVTSPPDVPITSPVRIYIYAGALG